MTLFSKKVFVDVVKGLEMRRSSWIIQRGLKFNGKCPHVEDRERGGDMQIMIDNDMSGNATSQDTEGRLSQQKLQEGGRILP